MVHDQGGNQAYSILAPRMRPRACEYFRSTIQCELHMKFSFDQPSGLG